MRDLRPCSRFRAGPRCDHGQLGLFDALLRHMDTDGKQEISREEFVDALSRSVADRPTFGTAVHTAALSLVQVADRDSNGILDSGEYADQAAAGFSRLDLDRNGVQDTAELIVAVRLVRPGLAGRLSVFCERMLSPSRPPCYPDHRGPCQLERPVRWAPR